MSKLTQREAEIARAVRAACAGAAAGLQTQTSREYDRLTDYARGFMAGAGAAADRIGRLDLEQVLRGTV